MYPCSYLCPFHHPQCYQGPTLQVSLSVTLPPNIAVTGYSTEGAFLTPVHLSVPSERFGYYDATEDDDDDDDDDDDGDDDEVMLNVLRCQLTH